MAVCELFLFIKYCVDRFCALISNGGVLDRISADLVEIVLKLLIVVIRVKRWIDLSFVLHRFLLVASIHIGAAYKSIGSTIP